MPVEMYTLSLPQILPISIWIMVPAAFVGATVDALAPLLDAAAY